MGVRIEGVKRDRAASSRFVALFIIAS